MRKMLKCECSSALKDALLQKMRGKEWRDRMLNGLGHCDKFLGKEEKEFGKVAVV